LPYHKSESFNSKVAQVNPPDQNLPKLALRFLPVPMSLQLTRLPSPISRIVL